MNTLLEKPQLDPFVAVHEKDNCLICKSIFQATGDNTLVKIQYKEDWTVIPVSIRFQNGNVQVYEDGMLMRCTHASYHKDVDTNTFQCDNCPAWGFDGEYWNE